ncbi:MAG: hypothetical protein ABSH49_32865 [Bryobacteraceae bacterium]|jgi:hypothetical protein
MRIPGFREIRVLLHGDLAARIDELAREHGESIESYIETVLRERGAFTGPKAQIYTEQKRLRDEE